MGRSRFSERHRYRAIIIENVDDAARWMTFPTWLMTMELLSAEGHYYSASETAKPTSGPHGTFTTSDRWGLMESELSIDVDDVLFRILGPDEIKVGITFARDQYLDGT